MRPLERGKPKHQHHEPEGRKEPGRQHQCESLRLVTDFANRHRDRCGCQCFPCHRPTLTGFPSLRKSRRLEPKPRILSRGDPAYCSVQHHKKERSKTMLGIHQGEIGMAHSVQSAGRRFREALAQEQPLQVIGAINANHALLAKRAGFRALYLSGGGVAAGSLGLPDLGISGLDDVLTDVRRITDVCDTPLLVDVDTGFGASAFNIARTTKSLIKSGAAAMHIEDQVGAKRCGHRPGKAIVSQDEMVDRVKAAADAKTDPDFVIMARTDALAVEGLQAAIDRACACVEAGADAIFPEAMTELSMYQQFAKAVKVPILANITEFGDTPLYTVDELRGAGVAIVLYPLSAFRAMNKAAEMVYQAIRKDGTQNNVLHLMQTRKELYDSIGYWDYENKLDALFQKK